MQVLQDIALTAIHLSLKGNTLGNFKKYSNDTLKFIY